jgi:acyl carrier protein
LSIDWGAFAEVGLAAAQDNRGARLAARGMQSLTPAQGLAALERLLDEGRTQVGVVPLNVRQWVEFYPAMASSPRLARLRAAQRAGAAQPAGDRDLLAQLAAAAPGAHAALLQRALRAQIAQVLRLPEDQLDLDAPLTSLGMDSLMGLELRNRIEATLGITVPATLLWTYPTVAVLSAHLIGHVVVGKDGEVTRPPDMEEASPVSEEATPLLDEDLFALLDASLTRAGRKGVSA